MIAQSNLLKRSRITGAEIFLTVLLGSAGFLLNTLELQLGWGVHFIFGNALVFAFARLLAPKLLVLGISISSLWTIFLWNHPWAWVVWVCEAIFIAFVARRGSPVRRDLIFWLILGAPMLLLTYGAIMQMDELSLALVIAKQSANGILNIVLGELLYLALVDRYALRKYGWPRVKLESAVITWMMAIILIPTAVYLALDAPVREQAARQDVGKSLEYRLAVTNAALNSWVQSRSLVLRMHAAEEFNETGTQKRDLRKELSQDFEKITISGKARKIEWSADSIGETIISTGRVSENTNFARWSIRLVLTKQLRTGQNPEFNLIVPFIADGQAGVVEATLHDEALYDLVNISGAYPGGGVFLVSALQGVVPLTNVHQALLQKVTTIAPTERMTSLRIPVLLSDVGYTGAVMSDLRDAQIMRSAISAELSEWQVLGVAPLAPAVIGARQIQLKQLIALLMFSILVAFIATVLSRRMSHTLRTLSRSAADLAITGSAGRGVDGLIIQEVNDVLGEITNAGDTVGLERGTLANYRRRLNSITQYAPVIVYALDVVNGTKGGLAYVSESLEKILGYGIADAMEPGWWSHAVHPEDYDGCIAQFKSLRPGKVVCVEYRLRHKNGHYVWVYDTVSVEPNPQSGALEAVGVIMDISERKAAAEQLLQADKMASLGRMISGTAHELNQPLNFIKMAASNMRENTVRGEIDADRFLPKLENVLTQVERASAIILQMRIFGRTPKEMPYPINVKSAIDAVVMMVAPQFELDGTKVDVLEKGAPVHVRALPVLLEQVLLNLLLNANDAVRSRHGFSDTAKGKIKITVERRSKLAVITVEDNGTGIPTDILQKIFDPFFTTKQPKEGTGLGLSISYGIIRDLGGVIRAKTVRTGARFTVELPVAEAVPVDTKFEQV